MQFLKANIGRPLSFVSCGQFICDSRWTHSKRTIDSFEVIIGVKGTAYIQQEEEKFEIHPGDVLILLPDRIHQGYAYSDIGTSFYWLHFYCRESHDVLEEKDAYREISPLKSAPYFNKLIENILVPIFSTPEKSERLVIQFKQLLHIANAKYITPYAADYFLTSILIELAEQSANHIFQSMNSSDMSNRNNNVFISILEWIRINAHKEISVEEVAERFNFNKDYLCRLFKKHLGVSTLRYINGAKISKAKELLCQSDKNIKEIAYELGFKDEKYFMKLFRIYENLTPSEYRNAYYQTHLNNI